MTRFRDTFLCSLIALTIPLLERQKVISSTLINLALDSLLKLSRFLLQPSGPEMGNALPCRWPLFLRATVSAGIETDPSPPVTKQVLKKCRIVRLHRYLCSQTQVTLFLGQWWILRSKECLASPGGEISSVIDVHR